MTLQILDKISYYRHLYETNMVVQLDPPVDHSKTQLVFSGLIQIRIDT